jgi:hypothetical protein
MSAEINWDFAVKRHTETMLRLAYEHGREEADVRCLELGLSDSFRARLIDSIRGVDELGRPY